MKQEIKDKLEELEKKGWILIGEVEYEGKNPFMIYSDDGQPWFMYTKYNEKYGYDVSFCHGLLSVNNCEYCSFDKRYSINTILCCYISQDRVSGAPGGGRYVKAAEGMKIRLVGYKDWIEVDEDFLNGRINIAELEQKFRTDKERKWFDSFQTNEFCKNKEEMKTAKIYT